VDKNASLCSRAISDSPGTSPFATTSNAWGIPLRASPTKNGEPFSLPALLLQVTLSSGSAA